MSEATVGIRELKTNLSKYLRRVKTGETLIITEHGKPIGRIVPEGLSEGERLQALHAAGLVLQIGEKLPVREPVVVNKSSRLMSNLISEDRDVDYLP
jgi:prevent-host-death family protein